MYTDVLIIGGGLAGLACALNCSGSVVVINDTEPATDVASAWAQGGLAAALGADDTPALHASDTLAAAAGIADPLIVRGLTREGPAAISRLERFGVPFDRLGDGTLALGLEAAHSRRRIVHAADHTGATIVRSLLDALAKRPNVTLITGLCGVELTQYDGQVSGGVFLNRAGHVIRLSARAVVLASGGYGGLFAKTTTPPATLGAGIAMAGRAGATLADLEFVQFHPTALTCGSDPMPLISEAVRGEGATLVDRAGKRFVDELAPRDIVSRAIFALEQTGERAFLDTRQALGENFAPRFPTIYERCMTAGVDPARQPIPVTPAAHYTIGGIATDGTGRTDLAGLWACGEVAATGLHGANRLASNSLMEALIFGTRAADDINGTSPTVRPRPAVREADPMFARVDDLAATLLPLRKLMSASVGVVREGPGLESAVDFCTAFSASAAYGDPRVRAAVDLCAAVARAALLRRESRGTHYRRDYSHPDARLASRSYVAAQQVMASGS